MTTFPLYDTLYSVVQDRQDTIDKLKLIKWIHSLDQDGKNKVYALIKYFNMNHNSDINGVYINSELTFDLDKFPIILQHILFEFTKLHTQHMKDLQKIEKIRKKSN